MNQKGSIPIILVIIILLIGLGLAVYLINKNPLIFKSKANINPITPVGTNITKVGDSWQTSSPTVEFELRSDLDQ